MPQTQWGELWERVLQFPACPVVQTKMFVTKTANPGNRPSMRRRVYLGNPEESGQVMAVYTDLELREAHKNHWLKFLLPKVHQRWRCMFVLQGRSQQNRSLQPRDRFSLSSSFVNDVGWSLCYMTSYVWRHTVNCRVLHQGWMALTDHWTSVILPFLQSRTFHFFLLTSTPSITLFSPSFRHQGRNNIRELLTAIPRVR